MSQLEPTIPLKKEKIFFPNLDGLRFFSFFLVFLYHLPAAKNEAINNDVWYQFFKNRLFDHGDLGVSFFFVLSGFLITYLLIKEKELTGKINVISFYIRRALRIWPLYYFCVLFGFIAIPILKNMLGQTSNETADPLLCSLFLNNYNTIINGQPDSSTLAVLWSVAIEEQFYLLWPVLFYFITPSKYKYIFIGIIIISLTYRFVNLTGAINYFTLSVISDMAMGGVGAYLSITSKSFLNKIEKVNGWVHIIPYIVVLIILIFKYEIFVTPFLIGIKRIIISFFFIWIILEQNFSQKSFFKISNLKRISILGKYTYGLYCLHTIALLIVDQGLVKLGFNNSIWQLWLFVLPIALGLSVALSYVSYHYFEKRFLKLKDRFAYIVKE